MEAAVRTDSSQVRDLKCNLARAITMLVDPAFEQRVLQDSGQSVDNPPETEHYMSPDSETSVLPREENLSGTH